MWEYRPVLGVAGLHLAVAAGTGGVRGLGKLDGNCRLKALGRLVF
jgi:hypothetical protein